MSGFFIGRTKLQLVGDIAMGALRNAKNGVLGGLLLAAARQGSMPAIGALGTLAGACALGGAIIIIPAMVVYRASLKENAVNDRRIPYLLANAFSSAVFAFVSGCVGAAILGLAVAKVGIACLAASLVFSLINLMTEVIIGSTAPLLSRSSDYLALQIAQ